MKIFKVNGSCLVSHRFDTIRFSEDIYHKRAKNGKFGKPN
jgi:hypothetical protein